MNRQGVRLSTSRKRRRFKDRDKSVATTAPLTFAHLDGELDAAIVFATALIQLFEGGSVDFGNTRFSDATVCSATVIEAVSRSDLTGEQRRHLENKLRYLRQLLDRLNSSGKPPRIEAS